MKVYILTDNGEVNPEVFTTLAAACKALGVSYRMALRGKRTFKNKTITEATIVKSSAKVRQGFKCLEEQRMNSWAKDSTYNEDA
jgi:hypothetical protein